MRKTLLPLAVLAFAMIGVAIFVTTRPTMEPATRTPRLPLVRIQGVEPKPLDFFVRAHGTVVPRREGDLVPQVSGPVAWVSPALASGGFFEAGEALVRIDRADYEVALESARAAVARAESEVHHASKELKRQKRLAARSAASQSAFDDAQNADRVASASLREAKARLDQATRDLDRTELRAPYVGRVRSENVAVGQFVTRGAAIGRIYSVDQAEVRLPIPDSELGYVDLPLLGLRGVEEGGSPGPVVSLRATFAGREHEWIGRVVRTEGEIDPRSRMVHVIARVDDPYARDATPEERHARPPLAVGLFVEAEIRGRHIPLATVLPRVALHRDGRVWVVDGEDRIHPREVEVLRIEADQIVVGKGLARGERVVVSPLAAVIDGMSVRVVDASGGGHAGAPEPDERPVGGGRS
jgi:RND family efflux transporter MFP subunit